MKYLVAFAGKPKPTFLPAIVELSKNDGVEIRGALLTEGPGCYNLGIELDGPNEGFMNALTMALMPAKWCVTTDPRLKTGEFTSELEQG